MKTYETFYFTLKEIKPGIYAAIAKDGTGAFSNAGVVDLGDDLLIFDAFSVPAAAQALRDLAEEITGKPVKYLFNSHWHGDHTFGNQVFSDVTIISTSLTRQLHMERNVIDDPIKEYEETKAHVEGLRKLAEAETDPINKMSLEHQYAEMACVTEAIPTMVMTYPNMIFEDHLTVHGSKRSVELLCYGAGHTPSDAILYIPEEKVAFMGDLLTVNMHLPIFDPYSFVDNHEHILKLDIDVYVPGHGDICDKNGFMNLNQYLYHLIEISEKAVQQGLTLEQVIEIGVAKAYSHWRGIDGPRRTLTVTYEKAKEKLASAVK
ncbi:MAG TPA: MBL fold metallo-hydrolase [Sporolactobacillaceae bacterium]|nr:MBL fold metallo-hydrolase [Sporolactobacillaceae bacterium]